MSYKICLEMFEGPLDLLLYLIRKNDINIYDIPIAKLTEQYIEYIELMKVIDLDGVGDFLVMAAELLRIKSRMLLPPDPEGIEDSEDPRQELVRRLEEYQRIRQAADELRLMAEKKADLFPRRIDEEALAQTKEEAKEVYFEANLFDLITSLSKALQRKPDVADYEVAREEYTVENKVHLIRHVLTERTRILLDELFGQANSKMEVIVTFMAVLELCRQRELLVVQKRLFSGIELVKNSDAITLVQKTAEPTAAIQPAEIIPPEPEPAPQENV